MDPVTHAASGAVAMLALPNRPASPWAVPLAAVAAAAPDVDVLFAQTPLSMLLLHRGITHALAAAPLLGLAIALPAHFLWRNSTSGPWPFVATWLFMTAMVLLHIWMDCITAYGTMLFLPFSHERVRLNAVFIVDLALTLPLLWALWRWRARRPRMLLALAWIFVYPGLALGLNHFHSARLHAELAQAGRHVERLVVLPDVLSPVFWRVIFRERTPRGAQVCERGFDALGRAVGPEDAHAALPATLARTLSAQSIAARYFLQFTVLPVVRPLPPGFWPPDASVAQPPRHGDTPPAPGYVLVHDLRYGSSLSFARHLMSLRPHAEIPFRYMAELIPVPQARQEAVPQTALPARLRRERMLFADSGRDERWHAPRQESLVSRWQRLVGLR